MDQAPDPCLAHGFDKSESAHHIGFKGCLRFLLIAAARVEMSGKVNDEIAVFEKGGVQSRRAEVEKEGSIGMPGKRPNSEPHPSSKRNEGGPDHSVRRRTPSAANGPGIRILGERRCPVRLRPGPATGAWASVMRAFWAPSWWFFVLPNPDT